MGKITISRAAQTDVDLLASYRFSMFIDMYPEADYSGAQKKFSEAARRYYLEKIDGPDEVSLIARNENGEPLGCGTIMFQRRPPHVKNMDNLFGYILNIYVRPEYRKRGTATALMRALTKEAHARGVKRIGLHASSAGAAVYRKLGYINKESYMEAEVEGGVSSAMITPASPNGAPSYTRD